MRNNNNPWLFFSNLFSLLLSTHCLINNQTTLLLQLKNTLLFNSSLSTKLPFWNTTLTPDCCHWPGVACDVAGHVTALDLSSDLIHGGFQDSTAFFLSLSLSSLNLANNTFNYTQIPPGIGNLTSLKTLNLSNSGFSGQIPIELTRLVNLEKLDLSALNFLGMPSLILKNPNLSTLLRNLTMLTDLRLEGVNISSTGSDWCGSVSSWLPNLKILSLKNSNLSGPIDSSITKLYNLTELYLGSNYLFVPVPEFFAGFVNLTVLSLSSCNLTGTFPRKIFTIPVLRVLDLENNGLLSGSLPEFSQNGLIESLVLKGTNFSGKLPDSIGSLKNLSRLKLAGCQFSGPIPNSLSDLTQLFLLDLQFNQFTGPVPSFQRLKNLSYLDLSHNALNGSVPSAHFKGLTKLAYADLAFNSLDGIVPDSLFSLPSLQQLLLSNNQFSGEIVELKNKSFSPLDTLDISSNKLQGNIPEFLFSFRKLNLLALSFNNFTGNLQLATFQNLGNLTSLDLSHNNLSIDLSNSDPSLMMFPQLSKLKLASCNLRTFPAMNQSKMITTLDISDNKITGKIPSWVWNSSLSYLNVSCNFLEDFERPIFIRKLSVIDLHSNQLKGEIPIPSLSAVYVDYSNNYFSYIPVDIGSNLVYATYFSLSRNNFSGPIPRSLCSCMNIQVLDLSNNWFTGSIPSCLTENITETLRVLNLGNNNLTGTIMGDFPENCTLKTLDINRNRLEGTVPKTLANCKFLEVLNLRNNKMSDVFPCFLQASSSLRVLVLRINKFQGDIWCSNVASIAWPKLQIIDLAQNNFSGELPPGSFSRWKAMMSQEKGGYDQISFPFLNLNHYYYQDTVTVTNKGLEMELVKILTVYTSIDFSSNRFEGRIPDEISDLKSLYVLNLSHNAFTNQIPSSLGSLKQLGSLDLSCNNLSGSIPSQLTELSFLSVFNLSYNRLVGKIPRGSQFNTFSESSYEGNPGLCGPPLNNTCSSSDFPDQSDSRTDSRTDSWLYISTGMGFGVGAGLVVGPLIFKKKGRHWCDEPIEKLVGLMFICLGIIFKGFGCKFESESEDSYNETVDSEEEEDEDDEGIQENALMGRFCVYCSKLDIHRRKAIHNPKCTCYETSPVFSFSSTSTCS